MKPFADKHHHLEFSYDQYLKNNSSISNCLIGHYLVCEELARGNYGTVYKGIDERTNKDVAIKLLNMYHVECERNQRIKSILKRLCQTESQLMMRCDNPNLLKCFDVFQNTQLKIMVIEYCNGGTLKSQITRKSRIPQQQAILILKQVMNGIAVTHLLFQELHRNNIIHRDLKDDNIMIHNGVYKIVDFGFSKKLETDTIDEESKGSQCGTYSIMAPEIMKMKPYGLKVDIWSIGIIFYGMLSGMNLFSGSEEAEEIFDQLGTNPTFIENRLQSVGVYPSEATVDFLKLVLVYHSEQRAGWKELVTHKLFDVTTEHLNNDFRLDYQLDPKILQSKLIDNIPFQNLASVCPQESKEVKQYINSSKLIKLSKQEVEAKKQKKTKGDEQIFKWAQRTHLECLKTEFILEEIIDRIEKKELLDFTERSVIEFMYLLCTRCQNNISVIVEQSKKHEKNEIIAQLSISVRNLFSKVSEKWQFYSNCLTIKENTIMAIIGDKLSSIFLSQQKQNKDRFMTGIQTIDYTKKQQIQFTKQVIHQILPFLSFSQKALRRYLKHYEEICKISLEDIEGCLFKNLVDNITAEKDSIRSMRG